MFEIKDLEDKDIEQVLALEAKQWGGEEDFTDEREQLKSQHVKIVVENDIVYGVSMWDKVSTDECYIAMIVLDPVIQHHGFGRQLMNIILDWCHTNDIKYVSANAIEARGRTNAKHLLEAFNFKEIEIIPNYWGKLYPEYDCPECGHKPCVCINHRYIKDLGEDHE